MIKKRVMYIAPFYTATFVQRDIQLLKKKYEVYSRNENWHRVRAIPFLLARQLLSLPRIAFTIDAIIVMFGGYWSLLPVILGKMTNTPVMLILGGTDCVSYPSINYGSLRKPVLRMIIKYSLKWATRIIPVDETLVYCENKYCRQGDSPKQGFKYYFPKIRTPVFVIHNGFDFEYFSNAATVKHKGSFVTVGSIPSWERLRLKGIDILIRLAEDLPDNQFSIVGVSEAMMKELRNLPGNVKLIGFVDIEKCKEIMGQSEYYIQLSISEGFPNSLCEGMLLQCIPVVTSVGGMPEIVGDIGLILENSDYAIMRRSIRDLLNESDKNREFKAMAARQRIMTRYPAVQREKQLMEVVDHVILGNTK